MFRAKLTGIALLPVCLSLVSPAVLADEVEETDYALVIKDFMNRRGPGSTSGSGHTVEANCPADPSGNAWQGATAKLTVKQSGDKSVVSIKVKDAVPNTVFTVWLRMDGKGPDGSTIGPSPLTGGGATPLAPGSALDGLLHYSPPFAGSADPTNGFITDDMGNAKFSIALDFPMVGGAYPFQKASAAALADWQAAGGFAGAKRIPSPVVNSHDPDIVAPFMLRVISHCTDGLGHGLSPATREAWFDY